MAHIDSGGGGRAKTFEPNLVPFIDLMSVLITFLLITAVWSQVSMIQIGSSIYGKKTDDGKVTPPPEALDVVLKLEIKPNGYVITLDKNKYLIALKNSEYDDGALIEQLQAFKQKYPQKTDAVIEMDETLPYEKLVKGMDDMLIGGFPQIAVGMGGPSNGNP